jgi:hypothetical protein
MAHYNGLGINCLKSYLEKLYGIFYQKHSQKPLKTILKLETSQRFGGKKGGCLSSEVIIS